MTASEGLTEAEVAELREEHRDSYPMGNIHHGTPERPDWGTFCMECKQSWPCDVSMLLDRERKARAEAWDEGHRTRQRRGPDDCFCGAWSEVECACGKYGTGPLLTPNPYRAEAAS